MEVRKIIKIGNSLAVTIPWQTLRAIGCFRGDHIKLILKRDRIEISKLKGGEGADKKHTP